MAMWRRAEGGEMVVCLGGGGDRGAFPGGMSDAVGEGALSSGMVLQSSSSSGGFPFHRL